MTETSSSDSDHAQPTQSIGYLNGQWLPRSDMALSVDDLGFRQAATVVERLRTYHSVVWQLNAHVERFQQSMKLLGFDACLAKVSAANHLPNLLALLLKHNEPCLNVWREASITLFATPGAKASQPTIGAHVDPLDLSLIAHRQRDGQAIVVTSVTQPTPKAWPRAAKVRCRLHYFLADQFAEQQMAGSTGLLLDEDGTITETSIANVAIVQDGAIVSPPQNRVLGGISQRVVTNLARELGISWRYEPITVSRLRRSDEVLLMGTGAGIWFVNQINFDAVNGGKSGEVYQRLRSAFDQHISDSYM